MRKLLLLLGLILFWPHAVHGQAIAQTPFECNQNAVTSKVCTLPTNVTAGNNILVFANVNAQLTISGSINNSDTLTPICNNTVPGGGQTIFMWIALNANAGSTAVTLSWSGSHNVQAYLVEVSGYDTTTNPVQNNCNQGNSTTMTPGSITTSATNGLFVCYFSAAGSIPSTLSGWTIMGASQSFAQGFSQVTGVAGTYNPSTSTLIGNWVAGIVALGPPVAGTQAGSQHGGNHASGGNRKVY